MIASTAIDPDTGIAKGGSLRTTEVAVPMHPGSEHQPERWTPQYRAQANLLDKQFPLWRASRHPHHRIGAKRHRGLGRVVITVEPVQRPHEALLPQPRWTR